jgi:hypothetical protein
MIPNTATLAQERQLGTTEERKVLALEMIADQLRSVARGLTWVGNAVTATEAAPTESDRRAGVQWENEGGNFQPDPIEAAEIGRTLTENFAVGGHNYMNLQQAIADTNLQHAIAETKRARRAGAQ